MSEMESLGGLESALDAAFSEEPVAPKAPVKQAVEDAPEDAPESDPADLLEGEPEDEAPKEEEADPVFELDVDGRPEAMPLSKLKEAAARGLKAGRGFEENARVREALQAHVQQVQMQTQFQQAVSQDMTRLQAIDLQLYERFGQIDWQKEYGEDPFKALQLKEQRDQLKEQRAAVVDELNSKQQQFAALFQQNTQRVLAAEHEAFLAKVPTWRNAEKANQERGEIASALTSQYGFTSAEVGTITDHRMLLVARDAAAYRKLLSNKDAKVKQARAAPATAKPGASATPNGRAEVNKITGKLKELGTKGNHRAQEELGIRLFGAAFK